MTLFVPQGYGRAILSLQLTGDPEPMAVTIGLKDQDPVLNTPNEIAAELADAFGDEIMPEVTNVMTLTQCEVYLQRDGDSWTPTPPDIGVATVAVVGSEVGTAAVQNTAYLIHKRSTDSGRRGRGRWYLPGVAEGDVSAVGAVGAGRIASLNLALTAFLARFGAGALTDVQAVILHGVADPAIESPPVGFPDPSVITSMNVDPIVATQRRRLRR